ncbi:MAG: hypothetical protein ABSA71_17495 [Desulfomonilia bacterium]
MSRLKALVENQILVTLVIGRYEHVYYLGLNKREPTGSLGLACKRNGP